MEVKQYTRSCSKEITREIRTTLRRWKIKMQQTRTYGMQ